MIVISKEVKIWNKSVKGVQVVQEPKVMVGGIEGPLTGLSKEEVRVRLAAIMAQVDLSKPDEVIEVDPRYTYPKQICKFSGN